VNCLLYAIARPSVVYL